MKFKFAITIREGNLPYLLQLAIPDGMGTFKTHEYSFSDSFRALELAMDYFHEFEKRPETILKFHKDKVTERESNLELPFFKG